MYKLYNVGLYNFKVGLCNKSNLKTSLDCLWFTQHTLRGHYLFFLLPVAVPKDGQHWQPITCGSYSICLQGTTDHTNEAFPFPA